MPSGALLRFRAAADAGAAGGEYDIVENELWKLVSLLLKSNPNVICLLWLPQESILVSSPAHERLVENRASSLRRRSTIRSAATPAGSSGA